VVRFKENAVRAMGRTATGVRGIKLAGEDTVVSLIVPRGEGAILTVTQNVSRFYRRTRTVIAAS
jgi:DNA gyrase subunit A